MTEGLKFYPACKFQPLRTPDEIRPDIKATEKETEGPRKEALE